jgi:hypothetical protein
MKINNRPPGLLSDKPVVRTQGLLGSAPYGAIIDGDRIIIGSSHGGPIDLPDDVRRKVQDVAKRYGAYYEGDGKDVKATAGLLGSGDYRGSWDDQVAQSVKGYPEEFLSGLFSNVEANGYPKLFADPESSIFDSIIKNQAKAKYFKDRNFDADTLQKFLGGGSQGDVNFLELAKQPATPENLHKFFTTGESLMWPDNWQEYPNKLGQYAKRFEDTRNQTLLNAKPGVYFAGAGHLPELTQMNPRLNMIGGERAND